MVLYTWDENWLTSCLRKIHSGVQKSVSLGIHKRAMDLCNGKLKLSTMESENSVLLASFLSEPVDPVSHPVFVIPDLSFPSYTWDF